jgi:O-antigen ligase
MSPWGSHRGHGPRNVVVLLVSSAGVITSLALGAAVVISPEMAFLGIAAAMILAFVASRPTAVFYLTVVAAFISVPDFVPTSFAVGGIQVRFYEPLVVGSLLISLIRYRSVRQINGRVGAIFALLVTWVVIGVVLGNPVERAFTDLRLFIYLAIAFFVSSRIPRSELKKLLRTVPAILFVSAGATLLASMFGFGLAGMQTDITGGSDAASRLISPATYPSIVVLSGVLALVIAGRLTLSASWAYWLPALAIVFLSFTRNSVISLGAAAIFALFALRSVRSVVRVAAYTAATVAIASLVYVFVSGYRNVAGVGWVAAQADAFSARVLDGISGQAIATDGSAQFRFEQENAYLIPEIGNSPLIGHGFGFAYKPIFTGRFLNEKSEDLQYYAHNFYLWLLVKSGFLGMSLFVYSIMTPVVRLLRSRDSESIACGAAGAGMLAACVVVPMPLGSPTALLLGVVAGICANLAFVPAVPSVKPSTPSASGLERKASIHA